MSEVQNDYLVGDGGNYTLKPGVNTGCKVKSWSIEKNENNGNTSHYLKIVYVQPIGDDSEKWSTVNELLKFPGFPLGKTEVNKNTIKYGFMNPLTGFALNFAPKEVVNERVIAVFQKLGIQDFNLTDETVLHTQLKTMVEGLFDICEKSGLFQLEGNLICGYPCPKVDSEGKVKQYLQPAKYGQGGCYQPAFRVSNNTELPAEKTTGFKDETDKKYQYWSYTRTQQSTPSTSSVQSTSESVDTGW